MGHKNETNERKKKDRNRSRQDKGVREKRGCKRAKNTIEEGGGGEEEVLSSLLLLETLTGLFRRRSSGTGAKRHLSKQYVPQ